MLKIKQCKALARKTLLGKYGVSVGAQILSLIFCFIFSVLTVGFLGLALYGGGLLGAPRNDALLIAGAILFAIMLVFTVLCFIFFRYGLVKLYLNICRDEKYGVSNIWYPFKRGAHPFRVVGVKLLRAIIIGFISLVIGFVWALFVYFAAFAGTYLTLYVVIFSVLLALLVLILLNVTASLYLSDLIIIDDPEIGIFGALQKSANLMKGRKLKALWLMIFSFLFWDILIGFCQLTSLWVSPYAACTRIFFYMAAEGTLPQNREAITQKEESTPLGGGTIDRTEEADTKPEETVTKPEGHVYESYESPQGDEDITLSSDPPKDDTGSETLGTANSPAETLSPSDDELKEAPWNQISNHQTESQDAIHEDDELASPAPEVSESQEQTAENAESQDQTMENAESQKQTVNDDES